jgi:SpoVK/Ycf46/Vps4 family AAA+-type ATPase
MNKQLKRTAEVTAPAATPSIRDRIKELRRIKAGDLRANAKNWRLHPEGQKSALSGLLKEIGFVGALIAREVEGGQLELIDGHLRADIAEDSEVPVLIVDLDAEEAAKILATYDPLTSMAVVDDAALAALLEEVDIDDNAELRKLMEDLQDKFEEEEETATEEPHEVPGMVLNPHEHYDYLVVLASTTHEWNVICDRLQLKPEKRRGRMGTCRAIRASRLLDLLKPSDA